MSYDLLDDIDALKEAALRWNAAIDRLPAWQQYADIIYSLGKAGLKDVLTLYLSDVPVNEICEGFRAACYIAVIVYFVYSFFSGSLVAA